jgi:DNA-binding transcriptional ArsR family regulator
MDLTAIARRRSLDELLAEYLLADLFARVALRRLKSTPSIHSDTGPCIHYSRCMDNGFAIAALGALAQGTRLDVFRLLVRHEPDGMAAGEIARQLDVPQNTMSAHLGILARAGIVRSERQSRSVIYRADLDGLRALTLFLVKDCCAGSPELCAPLLAELAPCC